MKKYHMSKKEYTKNLIVDRDSKNSINQATEEKEMSSNKIPQTKTTVNNKNNNNNSIKQRLDFSYDYYKRGSRIHAILKNGKNIKCNHQGQYGCYCFYCVSNVGLTPNSGIYNIKIKINNIDNNSCTNIIGITSQLYYVI